ncbi:MAG: hypothetical protein IJ389_04615 [Clostridia bacterium]|nr:hypothetical protein [Clostridia bacterium]
MKEKIIIFLCIAVLLFTGCSGGAEEPVYNVESRSQVQGEEAATDGSFVREHSPSETYGNYHGHIYTGGDDSEKYHYEPGCPGKNSHEITWDEAVSRGLEPCKRCVLR